MIVGARGDDAPATDSGSAYVFVRNSLGSPWVEQAKLTASDGAAGDFLGFQFAVDISGDLAAVGAIYDDDNGNRSGSAYVYKRSGSNWTEQAKLLASDAAAEDHFGNSVKISGGTVVIGSFLGHDNGSKPGSAFVFELTSDGDGDEVPDDLDVCSGTVIPESVPTRRLGVNRFALADDDGDFDTTSPPGGGGGPGLSFNIEDTAGCSCEQIIEALSLGKGHEKFGCSVSAMEAWVALVNP